MGDSRVTINAGLATHGCLFVFIECKFVLFIVIHGCVVMTTTTLPGIGGAHVVPYSIGQQPSARRKFFFAIDTAGQLVKDIFGRHNLAVKFWEKCPGYMTVRATGSNPGLVFEVGGSFILIVVGLHGMAGQTKFRAVGVVKKEIETTKGHTTDKEDCQTYAG